ncbi:MAG: S8 family peptidase [Saprospiraceae bacterium]|nr:S8 family peptidase [Saprospiraceae bacterium]
MIKFYRKTVLLLFIIWTSISLKAQNTEVGEVVKGSILVMLDAQSDINQFLRNPLFRSIIRKGETASSAWNLHELKYDVNELSLDDVLNILRANENILFAQANHYVELRQLPNDPKYDLWHWNLDSLAAPQAWDYTTGGSSANGDAIVVAVIDEGFDVDHEDLVNRVWKNTAEIPDDNIDNDNNGYVDDYLGWNFTNNNDGHTAATHGTSVASIIGAEGNNGIGMTGINWNVQLMCLSGTGNTMVTELGVLEAYAYIWEQRKRYRTSSGTEGAYVVSTNASLGINYAKAEDYPIWCAIYDSLGQEGILSVAATANSAVDVDVQGDMPTTCASEFLISVTQSTQENALHGFSGYGVTHIDLAAPGAVYAARPNDSYNTFGGTSGAAPHVAGAIGLLYAHPNAKFGDLQREDPKAAAQLVKRVILESVDRFNAFDGKTVSGGRLNIGQAMVLLDAYFSPPSETGIETIFPNPVETSAQVKLNLSQAGTYQFAIFNMQGQELSTTDFTVAEPIVQYRALEVGDWARGTYIIRLTLGKDCWTARFVK